MTGILDADLAQYHKWGWRALEQGEFPFALEPPTRNSEHLAQFFSGRRTDTEQAVRTLFHGRNILVRGAWGIGKTAFILTALQRLQIEAQAVGVRIFPIYGSEFHGSDAESLYRAVLFMLAEKMRRWDKPAAKIFKDLTGERTTTSGNVTGKFKVGIQLVALGGAEFGGAAGKDEAQTFQIENPKYHIDELLRRAHKRKLRVILAIDDLDKVPNQSAILQMLVDAKALLRDSECNFILTGRPRIAGWEELTLQALDVSGEHIHLAPLTADDLRHAAKGQLNWVRQRARDDFTPFTPQAIERISELSHGIPRQFNRFCRNTLEFALASQCDTITESIVADWLDSPHNDVTRSMPAHVRRVLYRIQERGGLVLSSRQDIEDIVSEIGVDQLWDAISYFDQWVREDWLVPIEEEGRIRLMVSPTAERALQSGKK